MSTQAMIKRKLSLMKRPIDIPIEMLRSLVVILEAGNFTKAASVLGLTQSAVSAQMKRLQQIVGAELFVKGAAHLILTEKGEFVVQYARRIVTLNDQIIGASGGTGRSLRVGLPTLYSGGLLGKAIQTLREHQSDNVQFFCDGSSNLVKRMDAGHLDVILAFNVEPSEEAQESWTEPLVWTSARNFEMTPGEPLPVLSWPESVSDQMTRKACEQAGVAYRCVFAATDMNSIMEALHSGMGYFVMPQRAVPNSLKIVRESFLPRLDDMHVEIYVNRDIEKGRTLPIVDALTRVFHSADSDVRRMAS